MNATHGKRHKRSPSWPTLRVPEPTEILGEDVLETIHDWEDVDADELRAACSRGEVLGVD